MPAIAASQFAPPFMISGVAVALPALGSDLAAGATALSLVETVFLAAAVALLLPAGRLADASDKATLFKLGMVAFALSSLLIERTRRSPRGDEAATAAATARSACFVTCTAGAPHAIPTQDANRAIW